MRNLTRYAQFAPYVFKRKRDYPLYLILFVTRECNAFCGHCLLSNPELKSGKLTVDDYEKIARSMGPLLFLLPTGGEPWLRRDLPQIVSKFIDHNQVVNVGIPSNGSFPDRLIPGMEWLLSRYPGVDFAIDISFDHLHEKHDANRKIEGLFDQACETYNALKPLAKRFENFNLNVCFTVSALNQYDLDEIYDFLIHTLGVTNMNHLLVRGFSREMAQQEVEPDRYRHLGERIKQDEMKGYHGFAFSDFINAIRYRRQDVIYKTTLENKFQLPCRAGELAGVIYPNGDVFPCELLNEKIGNLAEVDFHMPTLWNSPRAQEVINKIRDTNCHCTFECFLTANIFFNPVELAKVMREYVGIKGRKLLRSRAASLAGF